MQTDLFYYTGSGNSLWAARRLAQGLGHAGVVALRPIPLAPADSRADRVGLIFPVHIWGLPRRVKSFVETLLAAPGSYWFAVAANAGQVAATLVQLQGLLKGRGLELASGFGLLTPTNYIPWGGPGPEELWRARLSAAEEKLDRIVRSVEARERRPVEKGPPWQNLPLTALNRLAVSRVPSMDKGFWVDAHCNGCGICRQVCPCGNIVLENERPSWQHLCEQCLACIQWCPREAIQFGKKTPRYRRYHHPEVALAEIIASRRGREEG